LLFVGKLAPRKKMELRSQNKCCPLKYKKGNTENYGNKGFTGSDIEVEVGGGGWGEVGSGKKRNVLTHVLHLWHSQQLLNFSYSQDHEAEWRVV
jgi:hypothetical protein